MISIPQSSKVNNNEINCTLRRFTAIDALIILLLVAGTVLTLPAFQTLTPDNVAIFLDNRQIATYPLEIDREITVDGARGPISITIKNRAVAVTQANCPHSICKKSGFINNPHTQIVCAPNHLLISITSSSPDTLDAIVH